ncbi:MAG TPA: ATP-binding protein, partial [Solirubrobacteraceae bacterium]|nr:ATP-binding protein [Solirubrobacteraceae bacterium]
MNPLDRPIAAVRRMGVATQVALATAVVGVALLAAAVPFGLTLREARDAERENQQTERARTAAATALGLVVDVETGVRGFILTLDDRFLEPRDRAARLLPQQLDALRRLTEGEPALARDARVFADAARNYLEEFSARQIVLARGDRQAAVSVVRAGEGKRRVDALRAASARLSRGIEADAERRRAEQRASERRAVALGLAGLVVALVLLLLLLIYLRRSVARPARRLTAGARRLGSGDLSARVEVTGPHEFRDLAGTFNDMAASLQSSRGKLVSTNEELVAARREAELANEAKSEFLSRMSHELRTPLNSIIGFAQLLEMDGLDEATHDSVVRIRTGGEHLLALINEVLDLARVESGALGVSIEPVEASPLAAEAIELVRPLAERREIALTLSGGDGRWCVLADQQRLRQVLLNLLSNAIKYNRDGGEVRVVLEHDAERATLAVHDTGPGLSADEVARAFVPFERLDALHGDVEGTGLGLPLTKRMVDAMRGTLTVDSAPGRGSVFSVELPLAASEEPAGAPSPPPAAARVAASDVAATVLYIEDNSANVRLVERILARRPGIRLLTAMQGRRGIELAREHDPHVVLLDLHLPDMHGTDVLAELKRGPRT